MARNNNRDRSTPSSRGTKIPARLDELYAQIANGQTSAPEAVFQEPAETAPFVPRPGARGWRRKDTLRRRTRSGIFTGIGRVVVPDTMKTILELMNEEAPRVGMRFYPVNVQEAGLYHIFSHECRATNPTHKEVRDHPFDALKEMKRSLSILGQTATSRTLDVPVGFIRSKTQSTNRNTRRCYINLRSDPEQTAEISSERRIVRDYADMPEDPLSFKPNIRIGTLVGMSGDNERDDLKILSLRDAVRNRGFVGIQLGRLDVLQTVGDMNPNG